MKLFENLKHECVEAQAVLPNYYEYEPMLTWESVEEANRKLDFTLEGAVRNWANTFADQFPEQWAEHDEYAYRMLFGESLMALPEELDGCDCDFEEEE